ncbi:MAG: hypothetical protein IPL46_21355 [Saprospiraceae bacterium]|nr:hypothetical protein [Saprospiraceae bacterium]
MRTFPGLIISLFSLTTAAQTASLADSFIPTESSIALNPITKKVRITVKDMKTKESIPCFTIDFSSCGHPVYESSNEGLFSMETVEGFACYVRIAKRGYANLDLMVDYDKIPGDGKTYNIYLSRSPNSFSGHIRDTVDGNLYVSGANLELRSLQDKYIQRVESNNQGEFSIYLTPDTDYEVFVQHPDYHPYQNKFKTGSELDGLELKRVYISRIDHKKIPSRLGTEVAVMRKDKRLEGINYYSVQILAKHSTEINLVGFKDLEQYGEVFLEKDGLVSKVKVGKFFDRSMAERALSKINNKPAYHDAFLTQSLAGNMNHKKQERVLQVREAGYMVRLASYLNPDIFDGTKVEMLGKLSSVQKNEWTIMLLSGFDSLDEARIVESRVKDLGFKSAYVVQYNGEQLQKVPRS